MELFNYSNSGFDEHLDLEKQGDLTDFSVLVKVTP